MNNLNKESNGRLKVLLAYFSATSNTKKLVKTVENTEYSRRKNYEFT